MQRIKEFLNDVESKNIFSYEHYKSSSLNERIEIIKLLNEYYKLKYYYDLPKKMVHIDWDGVVIDTYGFSKKMLLEQYGIDYDTHDRSNVEADRKVGEFFKNLDWEMVLKRAPEINESKTFIRLFKDSNLYIPVINTACNSLNERILKEKDFIQELSGVEYIFCQSNHPKQSVYRDAVLIDDDDFYLRYWNGIPIRFKSDKPTIFPFINDLGEIYYLFPWDERLSRFDMPNVYDNYEQVMSLDKKGMEWGRRN